jgi:hypothetical protein
MAKLQLFPHAATRWVRRKLLLRRCARERFDSEQTGEKESFAKKREALRDSAAGASAHESPIFARLEKAKFWLPQQQDGE